ncbi:uncharacterized protein LOC115889440 [Sitophilus oryzae]|uniref:Uncharacterized protein LOC115889440 n=1 Tax=Sitophilus oryzae TaxID=7048 RepID=A0A6J2YR73_SITOR|nr:uncharacterized protein LOC115889440 [Sitophilus oryzae]
MDEYVPIYNTHKSKRTYSTWFTTDIIKTLKEKYRNFRKWKKTGCLTACATYKDLRTITKREIDRAYSNYLAEIQNSLCTNPKMLWHYINKRNVSSRIPGIMTFENNELNNTTDIVNGFATFFNSVYTNSESSCEPTTDTNSFFTTLPQLDETDVLKAMKKLKDKLTAGPDEIPSFLIRDCASVLAEPLTFIFNVAIKTATFPECWKTSKICPIFKSENTNNIEDYRFIAIISNFAKKFEMCIFEKLFYQVKRLIVDEQHGFIPNRSTVIDLVCFLQYTYKAIEAASQVDAISMDFSKAFDRMDHQILLTKLSQFGFSSQFEMSTTIIPIWAYTVRRVSWSSILSFLTI